MPSIEERAVVVVCIIALYFQGYVYHKLSKQKKKLKIDFVFVVFSLLIQYIKWASVIRCVGRSKRNTPYCYGGWCPHACLCHPFHDIGSIGICAFIHIFSRTPNYTFNRTFDCAHNFALFWVENPVRQTKWKRIQRKC